MSVRLAWLLALAVAVAPLAACDSGGSHPNPKSTTPTFPLSSAANVDCPKYAALSQRITDAQTKIYTRRTDVDAALKSLQSDLDSLKAKAPSDVDAAIDDMVAGFRSAATLLATPSPTATDVAERLSKLGPRLSADSQKITAYVTKTCK